MEIYSKYSSVVLASLSFWKGMASTLDLGNTFYTYNESKTPAKADRRALAHDWAIVGEDIWWAMQNEQTQRR